MCIYALLACKAINYVDSSNWGNDLHKSFGYQHVMICSIMHDNLKREIYEPNFAAVLPLSWFKRLQENTKKCTKSVKSFSLIQSDHLNEKK